MKHRFVKPLAFAVAMTLGTSALAAPTTAFDVNEIDSSINACTDFNGFVNAKWVAANPIPADRTRWGSFDALREDSLNVQRKLVEDAARGAATAKPGSIEQKIGYLYASGMDEVDRQGRLRSAQAAAGAHRHAEERRRCGRLHP